MSLITCGVPHESRRFRDCALRVYPPTGSHSDKWRWTIRWQIFKFWWIHRIYMLAFYISNLHTNCAKRIVVKNVCLGLWRCHGFRNYLTLSTSRHVRVIYTSCFAGYVGIVRTFHLHTESRVLQSVYGIIFQEVKLQSCVVGGGCHPTHHSLLCFKTYLKWFH